MSADIYRLLTKKEQRSSKIEKRSRRGRTQRHFAICLRERPALSSSKSIGEEWLSSVLMYHNLKTSSLEMMRERTATPRFRSRFRELNE